MTGRPMPIRLRALISARSRTPGGKLIEVNPPGPVPSRVMVLDTETLTIASQRLRFGVYRYYRCRLVDGQLLLDCLEEGIFHDDDLAASDPAGFAALEAFARARPAAVTKGVSPRIRFLSRQAFVSGELRDGRWRNGPFWEAVVRGRAWLVCFNLPFDVSRLAVATGRARGMRGGHSLTLFERHTEKTGTVIPDRYRPRLLVKALDTKRALKRFGNPYEPDACDQVTVLDDSEEVKRYFRGEFIDLRTLTFALMDQAFTLETACAAFGLDYTKADVDHRAPIDDEYIEYCRQDVEATAALFAAAMAEHLRHPVPLRAPDAYSAASYSKAYLEALGVAPIMERQPDFPEDVIARAMTAYFGGRTECRIRHAPMPVRYLDFTSMYPTVCQLIGAWPLMRADQIRVVDATADVCKLVAKATVEDCLDPRLWRDLLCLVKVIPRGDVFPVRAPYGRESHERLRGEPRGVTPQLGIGLNPLDTDGEALWFTLADVLASKLLTGRAPDIVEALRLEPVGQLATLRSVDFYGAVTIDPAGDFFRPLVEQRAQRKRDNDGRDDAVSKGMKTLACGLYGISAETNADSLRAGTSTTVRVRGLDEAFDAATSRPERLGKFAFPPLAAFITGGARLMLAILETLVAQASGAYAYCDTDSMMIVASPQRRFVPCNGGPHVMADGRPAVLALSYADVDEIRERLNGLNPYDEDLVPDLLKIESQDRGGREVYAYVISAKRYALFTLDEDGQPEILVDRPATPDRPGTWRASEHGLGHLINPTGLDDADRAWVPHLWLRIIRDALGLPIDNPAWLDTAAVSRIGANSPAMLAVFRQLNAGKPYADQIKPFNFLISANTARLGHPRGVVPEHFHLVAPYDTDPATRTSTPWYDVHGSGEWRITATEETDSTRRIVRVRTIRDVLDEYLTHPESKSLGPNGEPCGEHTHGLLGRLPVATTGSLIGYVGKEANRLDELEARTVHDEADVVTSFPDPTRDAFSDVLAALKPLGTALVAKLSGIPERTIREAFAGRSRPRAKTRDALSRLARSLADPQGSG